MDLLSKLNSLGAEDKEVDGIPLEEALRAYEGTVTINAPDGSTVQMSRPEYEDYIKSLVEEDQAYKAQQREEAPPETPVIKTPKADNSRSYPVNFKTTGGKRTTEIDARRMPQSESDGISLEDALASLPPDEDGGVSLDAALEHFFPTGGPAIPKDHNEQTRISRNLDENTKDGDLSALDTFESLGDSIEEWWSKDTSILQDVGFVLSIPQQAIFRQAVNLLENSGQMTKDEAKNILSQDEVMPHDIVDFYIKDPRSTSEKVGRFMTGFAADVLLDPLNMLAAPLSVAAKTIKVGGRLIKDANKIRTSERQFLRGLNKIEAVIKADGTLEKAAPAIEKAAHGKIGFAEFLKEAEVPAAQERQFRDIMKTSLETGYIDELRSGERALTIGVRLPFTKIGLEAELPTLGKGLGNALAGVGMTLGLGKKLVGVVPGGKEVMNLLDGFQTNTGYNYFDETVFVKRGAERYARFKLQKFEKNAREHLAKIRDDIGEEEFKKLNKIINEERELQPLDWKDAEKLGKPELAIMNDAASERAAILSKYPEVEHMIAEMQIQNQKMVEELNLRNLPFEPLAIRSEGDAIQYAKHMFTNDWFEYSKGLKGMGDEATKGLDWLGQRFSNKVDFAEGGRKFRGTIEAANAKSMEELGIKIFVDDPLEIHTRRMLEMENLIRSYDLMAAGALHSVKGPMPLKGEWVKFKPEHFKNFVLKEAKDIDYDKLPAHPVNESTIREIGPNVEALRSGDRSLQYLEFSLRAKQAGKTNYRSLITDIGEAFGRGEITEVDIRDIVNNFPQGMDRSYIYDTIFKHSGEIADPRALELWKEGKVERWKNYTPQFFHHDETWVPASIYDQMLYQINGHNLDTAGVKIAKGMRFLKAFRENVLWGPAYWTGNAVGNTLQYLTNTGERGMRSFGKALSLMMGREGTTTIRTIDGAEQIIKNEDLMKWAIEDGVFHNTVEGNYTFAPLVEEIASNREAMKSHPLMEKAKTIGDMALLWRTGRWIAEKSDQAPKLATYINRLELGFSRRAAAAVADKHFYTFDVGRRKQDLLGRIIPFSKFPVKTLEYQFDAIKNMNFANLELPYKVQQILKGAYVDDNEVRTAQYDALPGYEKQKMPVIGDLIPGGRHLLYQIPWAQHTMNMIFNPDLKINPVFSLLAGALKLHGSDDSYKDSAWDDLSKDVMRLAKLNLPIPVAEAFNVLDLRTNLLGGYFAKEFEQKVPKAKEWASYGETDPQFLMEAPGAAVRFKNSVDFAEHVASTFLYKMYFGDEGDDRSEEAQIRMAAKGEFIRKRFRQFTGGLATIQKMDSNFMINSLGMNRRIKQLKDKIYQDVKHEGSFIARDALHQEKSLKLLESKYPEAKELLALQSEKDALVTMYNFLLRAKEEYPHDDIIGTIWGVNTAKMSTAGSPMVYDDLTIRAQEIGDSFAKDAMGSIMNPEEERVQDETVEGAADEIDDSFSQTDEGDAEDEQADNGRDEVMNNFIFQMMEDD